MPDQLLLLKAYLRNWQTSSLPKWSLQPAPLTAFTTPGLKLLTSGHVQQTEDAQQLQLAAVAPPATLQTTATNFGHFPMPQFLTNQQQFFALNNAFFQAPFSYYGYTTGQQYLPQYFATLPTVQPNVNTNIQRSTTTKPKLLTTKRPVFRDIEPTTRKPQATLKIKPEKFQENKADFRNDVALLRAVEKINPEYVIEDIIPVPGQHIHSSKSTQTIEDKKLKQLKGLKNAKPLKSSPTSSSVKVEATGKTSTKGNVPEIPFDTYFLPYFSQGQQLQKQGDKKPAALILEPHSKAIVGNGGTAISTPISRAYLKRGVTTNVYFNPESVAIAGVGGKAHAQADLELDLIN